MSLTFREEPKRRVFETRVLRKIRISAQGAGSNCRLEKRKLPNKKLHDLYSSQISFWYQIKNNELGQTCGRCEELEKSVQKLGAFLRKFGEFRPDYTAYWKTELG